MVQSVDRILKMDVKSRLEQINTNFVEELASAINDGNLDELYLKYFSKKNGLMTELLKLMPSLSPEEKREFGPLVNMKSNEMKSQIDAGRKQYQESLESDPRVDFSVPVKPLDVGHYHPTTEVIRDTNKFFRYYGFSVMEGPELENVEYNFRKLNLPEGHPATDLQDSLYVNESKGLLMRTHTSSVESRVLTENEPPLRVVVPGKCYRNETLSSTNSSFFYQYQGFVVDKNITLRNLMWTLKKFHEYLFGDDVVIRFRYKYYPEVSPGLGADIQCRFCHGKGCDICKYRGWIEVLGSGMIHYNTLKSCGIDPEEYTGYAFGMGLDRLVMQKYEITDIRNLYSGKLVY